MENNRLYEVAIGLIPGIGDILTKQLISYCGSPDAVFKTKKGKLLKIPRVGESLANKILNSNLLNKAEKEIEKAEKNNTRLIFYTDEEYPSRLKQIPDAPVLLYFKGNTSLNFQKSIAIVGTREATTYGKNIVEKTIEFLKQYNPVIISGLAFGIDITAHKAALRQNLHTIGVMGSGIDVIYPSEHKKIAQSMQEKGGIMTEYPFDEKPNSYNFPSRNRIIAGMADAIIVAEAAEKGGALITANLANGYNREVIAVPGNVNQTYSKGCNKLIYEHNASIMHNPNMVPELLNWDLKTNNSNKNSKQFINQRPEPPSDLTKEEKILFDTLKVEEGIHIDTLSWNTQIPVNAIASLLLTLEFKGLVKALPGKLYKLAE